MIKTDYNLLNSIHTILSINDDPLNPKIEIEKYFETETIYLNKIYKILKSIKSHKTIDEIKIKTEIYLLSNLNMIKQNNQKETLEFIKSLNIEQEKITDYSKKIA